MQKKDEFAQVMRGLAERMSDVPDKHFLVRRLYALLRDAEAYSRMDGDKTTKRATIAAIARAAIENNEALLHRMAWAELGDGDKYGFMTDIAAFIGDPETCGHMGKCKEDKNPGNGALLLFMGGRSDEIIDATMYPTLRKQVKAGKAKDLRALAGLYPNAEDSDKVRILTIAYSVAPD